MLFYIIGTSTNKELESLIENGYSMTYIGSVYGVTANAVKKWLKKFGILAKTSFEYKRNNK